MFDCSSDLTNRSDWYASERMNKIQKKCKKTLLRSDGNTTNYVVLNESTTCGNQLLGDFGGFFEIDLIPIVVMETMIISMLCMIKLYISRRRLATYRVFEIKWEKVIIISPV